MRFSLEIISYNVHRIALCGIYFIIIIIMAVAGIIQCILQMEVEFWDGFGP